MKRPLLFVLIVLGIAAIGYFFYAYRADLALTGFHAGQQNSNAEQASPGLRPAQIVWQTVDRTPDGFKVQMPSGASEAQIPSYTGSGVVEQVEMIEAQVDPDTSYSVAWADNPPVERAANEDIEKTLDMARNGALGRTQTTLLSESRSNRDGYPEHDFSGRNAGGGILDARLILAGTRLYMLIAAFPAASARRDEDVNHFFDSFSLTAPPRTD
ncbi:MAG: hypothetical protein ABSG10_10550 [Terracidiphilus sp.]